MAEGNLDLMMQMSVEKAKAPMIRRYIDREFLIYDHQVALRNRRGFEGTFLQQDAIPFAESHLPGLHQLRLAEIEENLAETIDIKTMAANTDLVLEGMQFLCRTIAPPFKMTSVMTLVEDIKGEHAVRLSVYNYWFSSNDTIESLAVDLPVGQVLLVKNPWFKATADGGFTLRVDDPSNFILISDSILKKNFPGAIWKGSIPSEWKHLMKKQVTTTGIEWKNEGNRFFVDGKFKMAIESYNQVLAHRDSGDSVVKDTLCNRAAAYMALHCFQRALNDLHNLLYLEPKHVKGIYRKAKALCGLEKFTEAIELIQMHLPHLSSKKAFLEIFHSAKSLQQQQATGQYDFMQFYTSENTQIYENLADFSGSVRIAEKGSGIFATRDITAGELVILSKAFAIVFPEEIDFEYSTTIIQSIMYPNLVKNVAERIHLEPSLGKEVYAIYAGPNSPPIESTEFVNVNRISEIVLYNSFAEELGKGCKLKNYSNTDPHTPRSSGLWLLPSYLNHSCVDCNCEWSIYGNVMLVRAFKEVAQGEELLISYVNRTSIDRAETLDMYGITCTCRLCLLDQDTSCEGRMRIKLLHKIFRKTGDEITKGEIHGKLGLLEKLNALTLPPINPCLGLFLVPVASYFCSPKVQNYDKHLKLLEQWHAITEQSSMVAVSTKSSLSLITSFLTVGDLQAVQKWVEIFKRQIMLVYGTLEMANVVAKDILPLMEQFSISMM